VYTTLAAVCQLLIARRKPSVIASAAKQSMLQQKKVWIASSLRSSQ
jgi:hypothetical protein